MDWRGNVWKFATAFVVLIIVLNPEMAELAVFVDAIGLEMFLMLVEIQFVVILGALLRTKVWPTSKCIKRLWSKSSQSFPWKLILSKPKYVLFATPAEATLMHMLVFSASASILINAI